ncbi:MAG: NAD(P)-dependent glycerol-3-phosphate dehydrogenase [Oscillospiraceae bacterium]|nr:NAD(P)-dependent glycerol-3-phosphate dehydrogenase [Oscillospiraceae bacterium]
MNVVVLGSGAWGTALAIVARDNRHNVTLWSHDPQKAQTLSQTRENPLLKGVHIPEEIRIESSMKCLETADAVVFATPSFALRETAHRAADYLTVGAVLISATKGIERGTHFRMTEILREETEGLCPVAALSGPSHAEEVARRIPTGCVAAAENFVVAELVQSIFMNEKFRVYAHDDIVGVEIAGALKNVAALCCGASDGMGFGDNSKALLMTRAMTEMSRLARALGGRTETFAGLAGMGDLIVTCTSMHSRNRRAGILIGQGKTPREAIDEVGAVVEGYYAAQSAHELAEELGVEMPICSMIYAILYEGAPIDAAVQKLMCRSAKHEHDESWV